MPTSLFAATTVIVASTGPAHGTKTSPSAAPKRKPPPTPLGRTREKAASGRSISTAARGTSSVAAITKSSTIAAFRRKSCGSPSRSRIQAAKSVNRLKLATSPATMRTGFRPDAPPASNTGSTGSTHGEIAVTMPARNPIRSRTTTVAQTMVPEAVLRRVFGDLNSL